MEKELFVWSSMYELGIPLIDSQHKKWLSIMNKLYSSFIKKEANTKILSILKEMEDYTVYHFLTEERYFKQYGFRMEASHKKTHQDFKTTLKNFKQDYEKNPSSLTYKVMTFMQSWLRDHILKSDKEYVGLLKGKVK